jgi:hypothetical protein
MAKLNQSVTLEKLFGKKQFNSKEELWSAIVSHQKKFVDQWRNWLHWTKRGHTIETDNEYLKYAMEKSGIQNVELKVITELKETKQLDKLVRCECGKLFISNTDAKCPNCIEMEQVNKDPFEVVIDNIELMLSDLHTIQDSRQRYNARRELAWVLNKAYHRGYIGDTYYLSTCELIRATASLEREYDGIGKSYYDTSNFAQEGFYYDTMFSGEDE